MANILINTYHEPVKLLIDGDVLLSAEGTTQGDPLAMPMYALATIPLIKGCTMESTTPGMQMMMLGLGGYHKFESGGMISVILALGIATL